MTSNTRQTVVGMMGREFGGLDLGDSRREARAKVCAKALAVEPRRSFPRVFRSEASLEGFYRLLRNPAVKAEDILRSHVEATVGRIAEYGGEGGTIVVAHDETEATFKGEKRTGLGEVSNKAQGIFLQASLAVMPGEAPTPLGLLGLRDLIRETAPSVSASEAVVRSRRKAQEEKETDWWGQAALEAQRLLGNRGHQLVHVMDREADIYLLMAKLMDANASFVIRAKHNRVLQSEEGDGLKLKEALEQVRGQLFRKVPLSKRRFVNRRGAQPARAEREAQLSIRAVTLSFPRPEGVKTDRSLLTLSVVHVYEVNPPPGEPPVQWILLTNLPVSTLEEATRVVDFYRARWPVEEFFKGLKTGCDLEKRQLESRKTLLTALALFAPIAWALLLLRTLARQDDIEPATLMFSPQQLDLLRALSERVKLSRSPTLHEALLAIAGLGGHLKRNGHPGWQVLAHGFVDFIAAEKGFLLAQNLFAQKPICDQS
jgi:hypothetical protein